MGQIAGSDRLRVYLQPAVNCQPSFCWGSSYIKLTKKNFDKENISEKYEMDMKDCICLCKIAIYESMRHCNSDFGRP